MSVELKFVFCPTEIRTALGLLSHVCMLDPATRCSTARANTLLEEQHDRTPSIEQRKESRIHPIYPLETSQTLICFRRGNDNSRPFRRCFCFSSPFSQYPLDPLPHVRSELPVFCGHSLSTELQFRTGLFQNLEQLRVGTTILFNLLTTVYNIVQSKEGVILADISSICLADGGARRNDSRSSW